MYIDELDGTLVTENEDFDTVLAFFKDDRKLPTYIETAVLHIILEHENVPAPYGEDPEECFFRLPRKFREQAIEAINHMFQGKYADYANNQMYYLLYYLPNNVYKVWKPLLDLMVRHQVKARCRVLDIGTGPGSVPVGIIEFYKAVALAFPQLSLSLEFTIIEKQRDFIKAAQKMIRSLKKHMPRNLNISLEKCLMGNVAPNRQLPNVKNFDLITMSNFLTPNEAKNQNDPKGKSAQDSADIIQSFRKHLNASGSFIIIEPGEESACRNLKMVRNLVVNRKILNVYSPCVGIYENKEEYHCSCFGMTRSFWEIPQIYQCLAKAGLQKACKNNVPFNYVIFRKDTLKKYRLLQNQAFFTRLCKIRQKVNSLVNVTAVIQTILPHSCQYRLCDGSCCAEDNMVYLYATEKELALQGIKIRLLAGERIKLMHVKAETGFNCTKLTLTQDSRITVDY